MPNETIDNSYPKYSDNRSKASATGVQQPVWQYGGATDVKSTFCSIFNIIFNRSIQPSTGINNELIFRN